MDNWEIYYRTHAGKVLTGSPPLSFVSNGELLSDYRIYGSSGGVGDKTDNLFDRTDYVVGKYIDARGNERTSSGSMNHSNYITVSANSEYALSSNKPAIYNVTYAIAWYDSNKTFISRDSWIAPEGQGRYDFTGTSPNNAAYAIINFALYPSYANEQIMLNTGSTPLPYEPYGYKIPVVCGGTTTNIYLDEPLGENESISMSDTGVSIPTINGSNTLSIGTTVQPSNMYIKYSNGGNINQSLMTYLEYKYNVAKE